MNGTFKVGDRVQVINSYGNDHIVGWIGTVKHVYNTSVGVEFDNESESLHAGSRWFEGKENHCWNFAYAEKYLLKVTPTLNETGDYW